MFQRLMKAFNSVSEPWRGMSDLQRLYFEWGSVKAKTPEGDGKAVLILPGFLTNDFYTAPLQRCLQEKGYKVYGWDNGLNTGLNEKTAAHLRQHLQNIFEENGGRKISIVGHSLGGIFARELAREFPDLVESVVTLGSPFGMKGEERPPALEQMYLMLNPGEGLDQLSGDDVEKRLLTPPPVPATSIYSESDGIVPWRACLNPQSPQTENLKVQSSHLGLVYDPLAVAMVLDRLAQDPSQWKKFDPAAYASFAPRVGNDNDIPQNPQWVSGAKARHIFKKN